jgi:O-antigen chain-terminating methyltransferase
MSEQVRKLPQQEAVQGDAAVHGEAAAREHPVKDIRSLMTEIRERIKADVEGNRDKNRELSRTAPRFAKDGNVRVGDLQHSEELRFVNQNYAYGSQLSPAVIPSHRRGPLGRLIPLFKRISRKLAHKLFLADYLNAERAFSEHLVRHLNEIGRYIDARDNEVMRKIDRIDDEKSGAIIALQQALESLVKDRIGGLDEMIRGLEGIVNNFPRYTDPNPPRVSERSEPLAVPDPSYLLLENRYRGGEAEIERRLSIYPELFKGAPGQILEIGSGRGELQRLFKKAGAESYGVDLDTVMVNVANADGCDTKYGDGIAHLRSLPDASLGGLIAIQVVEHLTRTQLLELCELAKVKLKPGSKIVFETINPQSLVALSSNYFRDPTHIWPMHPDTLGYTATLAGLKIVETRYLSPVSPNHLLKEIPADPNHPPTVVDTVRRINQNLEQLNRLLYGFQDYALILEVA